MTREVVSASDVAQPPAVGHEDFEQTTGGVKGVAVHGGFGTLAAGDDLAAEAAAYAGASGGGKPPGKPGKAADNYTSRLIKYIPAEIVALYLTLDALVRSSSKIPLSVYWGIFAFGLIATYLYLWRVEKVKKQAQLHISAVAYCVWVFAIGGPFVHLAWYDPVYGGLLLPAYTFLIAVIEA